MVVDYSKEDYSYNRMQKKNMKFLKLRLIHELLVGKARLGKWFATTEI